MNAKVRGEIIERAAEAFQKATDEELMDYEAAEAVLDAVGYFELRAAVQDLFKVVGPIVADEQSEGRVGQACEAVDAALAAIKIAEDDDGG